MKIEELTCKELQKTIYELEQELIRREEEKVQKKSQEILEEIRKNISKLYPCHGIVAENTDIHELLLRYFEQAGLKRELGDWPTAVIDRKDGKDVLDMTIVVDKIKVDVMFEITSSIKLVAVKIDED